MGTHTSEQLERWIDRQVVDPAGRRVGTLADVYVDDATGRPEWLAVTTGLFGSRIAFVPVGSAQEERKRVRIAYSKRQVRSSPTVDTDGQLTEDQEERLYRHYGLRYRAADAVIDATDEASPEPTISLTDLQEEGSASLNGDVSPAAARERLARRDRAAVDAIDLRPDEAGATDPSARPAQRPSDR